ncbi:MAG: GNAT family N-acetyltransferase [Thermoplasmata archaeon]
MTLTPASQDPEAVQRLMAEFVAAADVDVPSWSRAAARQIDDRVRSGALTDLWLWRKAPAPATGLIWTEIVPAVGRKLHWFLSPADATPASIERLLRETDDLGAPGEPVLSILDWVPGLAPERWRQWLERRGWQLITRVDLFFPAAASIPTFVPPTGAAIRSATHADRGELVDLMESAYSADLRERALFMVSRDRRVDAERGIAELLDGTLGEWVASASFVARFEGRLAGAILVNLFHGPLITQVMVEPAFRRSGVASALLTRSIAAVRAKGLGVPRLVVTDSNLPAVRAYHRFGFIEDPGTRGGVWLDLHALAEGEGPGPS